MAWTASGSVIDSSDGPVKHAKQEGGGHVSWQDAKEREGGISMLTQSQVIPILSVQLLHCAERAQITRTRGCCVEAGDFGQERTRVGVKSVEKGAVDDHAGV